MFDEYHINIPSNRNNEDFINFDIHLKTLLDCLQLFGAGTNTLAGASSRGNTNNSNASSNFLTSGNNIISTMKYDSATSLLTITLEDMGVITVCELSTLFTDDYESQLFELFLEQHCDIQIIMKSHIFKDIVQGRYQCCHMH